MGLLSACQDGYQAQVPQHLIKTSTDNNVNNVMHMNFLAVIQDIRLKFLIKNLFINEHLSGSNLDFQIRTYWIELSNLVFQYCYFDLKHAYNENKCLALE